MVKESEKKKAEGGGSKAKAPRSKSLKPKKPKTKTAADPPKPTETAEERQERKRRAKGERKSKGENLLKEGGERKCKICAKTLTVDSFSAAQLRKAKPACDECCGARSEKGGPDHVPKSKKSAKEKRQELKELRERKKKEEAEAKAKSSSEKNKGDAAEDGGGRDDHSEPAAKKAKVSSDDNDDDDDDDNRNKSKKKEKEKEKKKKDFVATERFDPTAESDTDEDNDDKDTGEGGEGGEGGGEDDVRSRQIYVGGIPFYKLEEEIKEAFDAESLPVESIDCMTFPDSGRFRGIAILTFATVEAAKGALAWNGEEWDGKFLVVRKYAPKASALAPKEDKPQKPDVQKVEGQHVAFVANLNWDVTQESLRTALVGCEVKEVRMGVDKETGEFRGYAHVEFEGDEDLEQAVSLSGTNLLGREMKIAYATARKVPRERSLTGGDGEGGGDDGGGRARVRGGGRGRRGGRGEGRGEGGRSGGARDNRRGRDGKRVASAPRERKG